MASHGAGGGGGSGAGAAGAAGTRLGRARFGVGRGSICQNPGCGREGVNIAAQDIDTAALCVLLEDIHLAVMKIGWPTIDVSLELSDGLQEARLWQD